MNLRRFRYPILALLAAVAVVAYPPSSLGSGADWTTYLLGPEHTSFQQAATAITPANASSLVQKWKFTPAKVANMTGVPPRAQIFASPTVYQGTIYIGANTGDFYALNETTGKVIWKHFLGFTPTRTCKGRGFTSTATVAPDPVTGALTVYVASGDGYLYALDAGTGSVVWSSFVVDIGTTQNEGYNWSSPTVAAGHIFMGVSSHCDQPLIRGGVKEYDQHDGSLQNTYWTVPDGSIGGSVWSSLAATTDGSSAFVSTGNGDTTAGASLGDSFSIVRLDGQTLAKEGIYTIPGLGGTDKDFGASPTLFSATSNTGVTPMVGACNKNGKFYALNQNLAGGPLWVDKIGGGLCFASAIFNPSDPSSGLYLASDATSINGTPTRGSLREVNPATGSYIWQLPLPGRIVGSPSLNGSGVIAAAAYDTSSSGVPGVFLVDAGSGQLLTTLSTGGKSVWAQPVFADGYLLVGTIGAGLQAFAAP